MRLLAAVVLVTVFAPDAAAKRPPGKSFFKQNRKLCEERWPGLKKPPRATSRRCATYWVLRYGYELDSPGTLEALTEEDPLANGTEVTLRSATSFLAMAKAARAAAGDPVVDRAIEYFESAAEQKMCLCDVGTGWNGETDELFATVLAGGRLEESSLAIVSGLTLWKLRHAVYARHGRTFDDPDLTRFFYGDRGIQDDEGKLLPRTASDDFDESKLTDEDRANLEVIGRGERGEIPLD